MAPVKQFLTLQQKVKVIEVYNKEKLSVRKLSERFKIGKTQAADIIKNRESLMTKWHSNVNIIEKRCFSTTTGSKIDQTCYEWFVASRNKGIPITGPLIRAKAKEIAESLGNSSSFRASAGWLEKFRTRHNIAFKAISGEAASVNPQDVSSFLEKLPSLIKNYSPRDIYNADETGLFFRALPNKTLTPKKEKCIGGKLSKERITILHCVNMNGEKEKLLAIGKSAKPRAFKNIDSNKLPVTWKSNTKAWMTADIMREWLHDFDRRMGFEKRNILLFLDNAGSHPKELKLRNIRICFLPPNCTSVCQPLDQGIIKNFKTHYRTLILKHLLVNMETADSAHELVKKINLLDALYFTKTAWDQVTNTTIKNCFGKAFQTEDQCLGEEQIDPEDEIPLSLLAEIYKKKVPLEISQQDLQEFFNIDHNLSVEEPVSDENHLSVVVNQDQEISDESDDELCLTGVDNSIKTYIEAMSSVKSLKTFSENQGDDKAFGILSKLEIHFQEAILQKRTKQTTLDEFLSKV